MVFIIHGFKFRYILLDEKFTDCIKDPQHEENNLITVGSRGIQSEKDFLNCLEVPLASVVLTGDKIIDGEIVMESSCQ